MIRAQRQVLTGGLLLLLSSCSPKPSEILLDTKAIGANALIALVQQHQNKVQSVVGKGTVTFESPEIAGSAAFAARWRRDPWRTSRFLLSSTRERRWMG